MIDIDLRSTLESFDGNVPDNGSERWQRMRCPFHEDRTASASVVFDHHPRFCCLGCGIQGDALDLIKEQKGLDAAGAITWARDNLGFKSSGVRAPAMRQVPWRSDDD